LNIPIVTTPHAAHDPQLVHFGLMWKISKHLVKNFALVIFFLARADLYLTKKELHQLHLDEEALRETLEEQVVDAKAQEEKIGQKQADDDEFFLEFEMVRIDSDYESSN
nr:hypothetical protein [Tanacetum cinerariifolium]